MHPARGLISINKASNKVEVLDLPSSYKRDNEAPYATMMAGPGSREGLLDVLVVACMSSSGVILILEQGNRRIQAFDLGMNPVRYFHNKNDYFLQLYAESGITYLDMSVEQQGFIYLLSKTSSNVHRLDIYSTESPNGSYLSRTVNVNAGRFTVDNVRIVYTMNYEMLRLPNGSFPAITEPSLSQWLPETQCRG